MGICCFVNSRKRATFPRDFVASTTDKPLQIQDNVVVFELTLCLTAPNIVKLVLLLWKLTKECNGLQQRQSTVGTAGGGNHGEHFAIGGETSHRTLRGGWIGSRGLSLGPTPSLRATECSPGRYDSACFNNGMLRAVGTTHGQADRCQTSATGRAAEWRSGGAGRGRWGTQQGRRCSLGISTHVIHDHVLQCHKGVMC